MGNWFQSLKDESLQASSKYITIPSSLQTILDPEFQDSVTYKSDVEVELLFSVHEKGRLSHNFTRLTYITRGSSIEFRSFIVELFKNPENNIILSITKETEDHKREGYYSTNYFITKTRVQEIERIAKLLMANRPEGYSILSNQCRHYTRDFIEHLKKQPQTMPLKFNPSELERYYKKFPHKRVIIENGKSVVIPTQEYMSFTKLLTLCPPNKLDEKLIEFDTKDGKDNKSHDDESEQGDEKDKDKEKEVRDKDKESDKNKENDKDKESDKDKDK